MSNLLVSSTLSSAMDQVQAKATVGVCNAEIHGRRFLGSMLDTIKSKIGLVENIPITVLSDAASGLNRKIEIITNNNQEQIEERREDSAYADIERIVAKQTTQVLTAAVVTNKVVDIAVDSAAPPIPSLSAFQSLQSIPSLPRVSLPSFPSLPNFRSQQSQSSPSSSFKMPDISLPSLEMPNLSSFPSLPTLPNISLPVVPKIIEEKIVNTATNYIQEEVENELNQPLYQRAADLENRATSLASSVIGKDATGLIQSSKTIVEVRTAEARKKVTRCCDKIRSVFSSCFWSSVEFVRSCIRK